jgi:hypothetical protein
MNTFQISMSKPRFDWMHWNVSIGPHKWPFSNVISIKTSRAARKIPPIWRTSVDDVTASPLYQHFSPLSQTTIPKKNSSLDIHAQYRAHVTCLTRKNFSTNNASEALHKCILIQVGDSWKSSRSDWGLSPRTTATPPGTQYQRFSPLSQIAILGCYVANILNIPWCRPLWTLALDNTHI